MKTNVPTSAEADALLAKMVREKLLTQAEAFAVDDAWEALRRAALLQSPNGAVLAKAERVAKILDYLSKGVDKAQANLADIDRRIHHLEHQSFERHVAAQPSMRIQ